MATFRGSIASDMLGMRTGITIDVPFDVDGISGVADADMPIVYLLHGLSDNNATWTKYSNIERYADYRGFIVVMPEVQRSFYSDMVYGPKYFSYVADELPMRIKQLFGIERPRGLTFAAGLSMGGYGAVKLALSRPERFRAAASFSGVLDVQRAYELGPNDEFYPISKGIVRDEDNLFYLAEQAAKGGPKPDFFITCGADDNLVDIHSQQKTFMDCLDRLGYNYKYEEWPGTHEWRLWDKSAELALDFFKTLK